MPESREPVDQKCPPGVTWHKREQKFKAKARWRGRTHYLGTYANVENAAAAVAEFKATHPKDEY